MKCIRAIPLLALALLWPGCGGDDDSGKVQTTTGTVAQQAVTPGAAPGDDALKLGDTANFNGVTLRIVSWQRKSPTELGGRNPTLPEEGWLVVHVESENTTGTNASRPDLSLLCADGSRHSQYADDAPDALKSAEMPAKSQESGTVLFGTPPNCFPATILASPVSQAGGKPEAQFWRLQ
ncbi:MAG: hypothetical protein AB7J35_21390 [Dehalococcoidia bacterium]